MSGDGESFGEDAVWTEAWAWVIRQHEDHRFESSTHAEFAKWLAADPAHRRAYEHASRVWLSAGLVPPANDVPPPEDEEPENG